MDKLYRKWLLKYAVHLGVAIGLRRGDDGFQLEELIAEMEDDDLLDDLNAEAKEWLQVETFQIGPFHRKKAAGPLVVYDGVRQDDFPHPGRPPR